jgi:hypothetical protein
MDEKLFAELSALVDDAYDRGALTECVELIKRLHQLALSLHTRSNIQSPTTTTSSSDPQSGS